MNKMPTELVFLKQRLSDKLPSLLIWILIWSSLLLLFATVFNSLSKDAAETSKVFQQLPKGVFNSFNIDPASYLSHIESFISGQFLSVYLLAGSIYSFTLGERAIGKKIESKTIATILTKPISRLKLYLTEVAVSTVFLVIASSVLYGVSLLIFKNLLKYQDVVSSTYFGSLFLGSCLLFITFAVLGQLIGTLLGGGKAVQLGAAVVVVSWFVNGLAQLAHLPHIFLSLSLFHYFDVNLLRSAFELDTTLTAELLLILIILIALGSFAFKKKDIYL